LSGLSGFIDDMHLKESLWEGTNDFPTAPALRAA
jgi:hypothetical protein